jgi:hypothetical protein
MNQNLEVLAQFAEQAVTDYGTRGNKLSISASGKFEKESGISGSFSRTFSRTEQSFTSQRIQRLIRQEFTTELAKVKDGQLISDDALDIITLCFRAYRGFRQIATGYTKRKQNGEAIDMNEIYLSYKEIPKLIKTKIKSLMLHASNIGILFPESQRTFLTNYADPSNPKVVIDLVNGGICWGISAKWCTRWVSGKKGFGVRKTKYVVAPLFDEDFGKTYNTDDKERFQKKATEMFVLMHHQNLFFKKAGFVGDAMKMFLPTDKKTFKATGVAGAKMQLSTNDAAAKSLAQSPTRTWHEDSNLNSYISRIDVKYADIKIDGQVDISDHTNGQKYHLVGPNSSVVKATVDELFNNVSPHKATSAFLIYWDQRKVDGGGGHAMASAYDLLSNSWFFMDPNYGEWHGSFDKIKNVLKLIISLYSIECKPYLWSSQRIHK